MKSIGMRLFGIWLIGALAYIFSFLLFGHMSQVEVRQFLGTGEIVLPAVGFTVLLVGAIYEAR